MAQTNLNAYYTEVEEAKIAVVNAEGKVKDIERQIAEQIAGIPPEPTPPPVTMLIERWMNQPWSPPEKPKKEIPKRAKKQHGRFSQTK